MKRSHDDHKLHTVVGGVAADQADMRYHPMVTRPRVGSRFAGTRTEKIAVRSQARRQSKKYRSMESMAGAAQNALNKGMHRKKKPRGVSADAMQFSDRKDQERAVGGKMRRRSY